jgi:glycosyltransferase
VTASNTKPLLSIVTICFNSITTISDTFKSLHCLSDLATDDVEYLIVDGGSSDGTSSFASAQLHLPIAIVSEPDHGLYDAMNKGLARARGEYVWYLNADDMLSSPNALKQVLARLRTQLDVLVTDIDMVDAINIGKVVRRWRSFGWFNQIALGWHPPHPGFIARRALLQELRGFDTSFKIAADIDLMTRAWRRAKSRAYLPVVLVHMRSGGASNGSVKGIAKANYEVLRSLWNQGVYSAPLAVAMKLSRKVLQVLRQRMRLIK